MDSWSSSALFVLPTALHQSCESLIFLTAPSPSTTTFRIFPLLPSSLSSLSVLVPLPPFSRIFLFLWFALHYRRFSFSFPFPLFIVCQANLRSSSCHSGNPTFQISFPSCCRSPHTALTLLTPLLFFWSSQSSLLIRTHIYQFVVERTPFCVDGCRFHWNGIPL